MSVQLFQSKLETIGDALATHIEGAPALAAEGCEAISKVDGKVGSMIEERTAKGTGLVAIVALEAVRSLSVGAPGPRIKATWNVSLWARRSTREKRNSCVTLYEAMLARVQGWEPEGSLCYDEFQLDGGGQVPHTKYVLYEASFTSSVQISAPVPIAS